MPAALPHDKPTARREIRARRRHRVRDTSPAARERQAVVLCDHLTGVLERLPPGSLVTSFEALPSEPPTHRIHDEIRRRDLDLLLPVLLDDRDLDWSRPGAEERLGVDAVGRAALVLLPALAIADDGMRLGQGGGSYDRALARVGPQTPLIAVVHDDELSARVPAEAHDRPVDAVVTAAGGLHTFPSWESCSLRN